MDLQGRLQSGHGFVHVQRRPHRPFRIVAMGDRSSEHGHDRISDVFVDATAIVIHDAIGHGEETIEDGVRFLRVEGVGHRREARQIREQNRHLPPFGLDFFHVEGRVRDLVRIEEIDRRQNLATDSDRKPHFLEIFACDMWKYITIDLMANE